MPPAAGDREPTWCLVEGHGGEPVAGSDSVAVAGEAGDHGPGVLGSVHYGHGDGFARPLLVEVVQCLQQPPVLGMSGQITWPGRDR